MTVHFSRTGPTVPDDFWRLVTNDLVALYAAVLSTVIAVVAAIRAVIKWFTSGPRAWVGILNPKEVLRTRNRSMVVIIANVGADPIVVREIIVTLHDKKRSPPKREARFYHGTPFDPAMQDIPNPNGKQNSTISVPRIIRPWEEMHQHMLPVPEYDPSKHWLRVRAFLRHRKSPVIGWAAPIPAGDEIQKDDLRND